ncbi:LANO_0F14312g1_1 [Lachancea nothofagi CBS 11611]|uniref:ATPase expression protein 2, mitochondrial n=1 Tax=Lachancea nothofagi CBS 11611 TaxID=1266666 RepID=A0A1G4KC85_9SACH|nr:LANO_0F14312g1_1 [Lachancea nothofagi CBS 11611]
MLPKRGTIRLPFKKWNSTVAINYNISNADLRLSAEQSSLNASLKKSIKANVTLQNVLKDRNKSKILTLEPLVSEHKLGLSSERHLTRLSALLHAQEYITILVEITLQSKLDEDYGQKIFTQNILTHMEFSSFIQGLLNSSDLANKLTQVAPPGTHGAEMIFNLYKIYLGAIGPGPLSPLQLHDLNQLIHFFIKSSQLRKAQMVLDKILDSYQNQLPCDVTSAVHYLQLRCGALPRSWPVNTETGIKFRSPKSRKSHVSSNYKAFDKSFVQEFLHQLNNPANHWSHRSSTTLESAVIYSLGFMGQVSMIEDLILKKWGISLDTTTKIQSTKATVGPTSEILISILTSLARNNQMASALQLIDLFITKYPEVELNKMFWRRLFQHSTGLWNPKKDPRGQLSSGCWEVMQQWHETRGRQLHIDIILLEERYVVLRMTNNYKEAIKVFPQCLSQLYEKNDLTAKEIGLVQKYAKLILKNLAASGNYHNALQFIKEWSPNNELEISFRSYFDEHRERYLNRNKKKLEASQQKQKAFDDEEEDGMLLGRLW